MKSIKLSAKSRLYLRAFGLLALLFFLGLLVSKFALSQIPAQKVKLTAQLTKERTLAAKAELLRTVEADALTQASAVTTALPAQNSSFVAIAQIRKEAAANSIIVTNLRVGAETKEGSVSSADLTFDAEGALPPLITFVQNLANVAPIVVIDRVQINQAAGASRATVKAKVFWAELPKTLPAVSEPVKALSPAETEILKKVVGLTQPDFVFVEPEAPRENTNPF